MTPELWQRLKPLFHSALDRAVEERPAFISEACGDDGELKENLERLIQAAEEGSRTFDEPHFRPLPFNEARFRSGEVILGRFRIVRPIGSGGMGEVYEAEDLQLGRVALKTIRSEIASSSGAFDRFRQEVQLARKVSGSQVCRIHELYLLPPGGNHAATAFLTMEYLDGITLSGKLKKDGPLPLREAMRVALDICEGLRLVHAKGVIHRDLKSANIMLCGDAEPHRAVLMDFGLARAFRSDESSAETTAIVGGQSGTLPGAIMGTPAYMAPEQFEGNEISPATDIYALGIILYELVTGLHPYAAPTPVAAAIRRAQPPAAPSSLIHSVPRKWDRIIQQCLRYEPKDRYQSADEVAKALRAGPVNLVNLRTDRPWLFHVACALVLASFSWVIFIWWQTGQYYRPGPEALSQYNNGLSLIRQGNYAEATRVLQSVLSKDKHFVMAHARLAEAWYNLDFQGNAQQELLIALPGRGRLNSLDRMYLDAIHATVTGDSAGALEDYKQILDHLPSSDKSSGYVDLGMAYERTGDIAHSLNSYKQAASLDGSNPAAYMHTGILQSRQHHVTEGKNAFDSAQEIFENQVDSFGRKGNPEGLAEVDYERGYAANARGDSRDAERLLLLSLGEAAKISSIQLGIRTLSQLSSAQSANYEDADAVKSAEQAVRLARDNQLGSWTANGLVRLANVQLVQGHLKDAEQPLQEAMQILHQSSQPRVEALANSTLASLMEQEHHPEKVAEPAQAALDYYKKNGFSEGARYVALLIVRTERDKGQYKQAMEDGNALLALAVQSGLPVFRTQAEENVGTVYLELEQYPAALEHFQNAEQLANSARLRSYQEFDCGRALWKLGRYAESEAKFAQASSEPALVSSVDESRVESLLSQQKYAPAVKLAQQAIAKSPDMVADRKLDLAQDKTLAEAYLGMNTQAMAGLSAYFTPDSTVTNPADAAHATLMTAEIYLTMGMNKQARDAALAAQEYFASAGKLDSELRSAFLAAAASKALKDNANFNVYSKKVIDILTGLRQTWGPEPFQQFVSRPDIHALTMRAAK